RVNEHGVWMLEAAARPIGGICSRVIRFESGMGLEEAILRHALGEDLSRLHLAPGAHGVMMIPVPRAGIYSGVNGIEQACGVEGVEEIEITAKPGQALVPLPEGASYLGFIFARGASSGVVDASLRAVHSLLRFEIAGTLPLIRQQS
ncbi:MAG: ATP-grasp domain-containing protein, partial [Bryobacteraceae bacterium]